MPEASDGKRTQADKDEDEDYQAEDGESCSEVWHKDAVNVGRVDVFISDKLLFYVGTDTTACWCSANTAEPDTDWRWQQWNRMNEQNMENNIFHSIFCSWNAMPTSTQQS